MIFSVIYDKIVTSDIVVEVDICTKMRQSQDWTNAEIKSETVKEGFLSHIHNHKSMVLVFISFKTGQIT